MKNVVCGLMATYNSYIGNFCNKARGLQKGVRIKKETVLQLHSSADSIIHFMLSGACTTYFLFCALKPLAHENIIVRSDKHAQKLFFLILWYFCKYFCGDIYKSSLSIIVIPVILTFTDNC